MLVCIVSFDTERLWYVFDDRDLIIYYNRISIARTESGSTEHSIVFRIQSVEGCHTRQRRPSKKTDHTRPEEVEGDWWGDQGRLHILATEAVYINNNIEDRSIQRAVSKIKLFRSAKRALSPSREVYRSQRWNCKFRATIKHSASQEEKHFSPPSHGRSHAICWQRGNQGVSRETINSDKFKRQPRHRHAELIASSSRRAINDVLFNPTERFR